MSVGLVSLVISLLTRLSDFGTSAGLGLYQLVGDQSSRLSEYIQQ